MKKALFCLLFVVAGNILNLKAQTTGSITVGGDIDKFYPTTWVDGGWNSNVVSQLEIGRSSVHANSNWRGSLIARFDFHVTNWGHGANFIDADIIQDHNSTESVKFIAGWSDATFVNASARIIIWLRGGGTTYYYKSLFPVAPVVYDGLANPLPFLEEDGPPHNFKTTLDPYVNSNGLSKQGTAYFYGDGPNYFSGNVGVGTWNTKGYKLAVAGNMIAESVKVQLQGSWADYVFEDNYKLQSLSEVEAFVKKNKHLPEIPSAETAKTHGIDLEDMNAKLLKKIEELTLHLIDMKKGMEKQEKEIQDLKSKIK